ncbi:MAG: hypothetical protein ACREA8_10430, partial [Nitrosotalea sp.]
MLGKKESMQLYSYAIMICLVFSMGVAPVFAQTSQQYVIKDAQSGQSFQVSYGITGATVSD